MNKDEIKQRIDKIENEEEFNDVKKILLVYPSIKERVEILTIKVAILPSSGKRTYPNITSLKKTLNVIVDDYKFRNDILSHFKSIYDRFIESVKIFIK